MSRCWLGFALALASCYQPAPHEGAPCSETGHCPSPLHCDHGICRLHPLDVAASDTGDAAPGCAPVVALSAFSVPVVSASLATVGNEATPTMTADRLEVYFKSTRAGGAGGYDIWGATRTSVTSAWSTPVPITEVSTPGHDASPEVAADGLTLWIASTRAGGVGGHDIWMATRATRTSPWGTPIVVTELSSLAYEEGLHVQPSQLVAYLHSDRDTVEKIYRASRSAKTASWSTPVVVSGLPDGAANPWVTPDDCAIYFDATRPGGLGYADLYVSRRDTPEGNFGDPTALVELNGPAYDADLWLSADERYIIYASDRQGGGLLDVFEASR